MGYKLIIGATIDIAKLFASIKVTLSWDTLSLDFNVLYFFIVIAWKLIETNSQSFWEHGHY